MFTFVSLNSEFTCNCFVFTEFISYNCNFFPEIRVSVSQLWNNFLWILSLPAILTFFYEFWVYFSQFFFVFTEFISYNCNFFPEIRVSVSQLWHFFLWILSLRFAIVYFLLSLFLTIVPIYSSERVSVSQLWHFFLWILSLRFVIFEFLLSFSNNCNFFPQKYEFPSHNLEPFSLRILSPDFVFSQSSGFTVFCFFHRIKIYWKTATFSS